MTPNNVSPPSLNNNTVSSVLDFSSVQKTQEQLAGNTIVVGGKTYTYFTDVFPRVAGPGYLLDPRSIAEALVSAINFDPDGSGVFYDSNLLQSANPTAEAYARGAIVTILSRTGAAVAVDGSVSGITPETPTGTSPSSDSVAVISATASYGVLPHFPLAKSFTIDNLSTSVNLLIKRVDAVDFITVYPQTGRGFNGNPSSFEIKAFTGTLPTQLQISY